MKCPFDNKTAVWCSETSGSSHLVLHKVNENIAVQLPDVVGHNGKIDAFHFDFWLASSCWWILHFTSCTFLKQGSKQHQVWTRVYKCLLCTNQTQTLWTCKIGVCLNILFIQKNTDFILFCFVLLKETELTLDVSSFCWLPWLWPSWSTCILV